MLEIISKISIAAGAAIMKIYEDEKLSTTVDYKADDSPLTLADKASNDVIVKALTEHFPHIPILSEEEKTVSFQERENWDTFWCVDPLDGTKEFIKRNGEFTVNIALIVKGYPVLGVIYAPVTETLYTGDFNKQKAFKNGERICVTSTDTNLTAVGSRSHASNEDDLLKQYDVVGTIAKGSSLKFCMVAEGSADLYYRAGPTMEWDTAAGQAIVEAAGGNVLTLDKQRFKYNKQNLLNPGFLVLNSEL